MRDKHARHVGVHDGGRLVEGEGKQGPGRVRADAGKLFQSFLVGGECSAERSDDFPRNGLEGAHAAVIPQTLPGTQGRLFVHRGQVVRSGEAAHPEFIPAQHRGDGGLLEHQLGDEDVPWIFRAPPRVVFSLPPEPFHQSVPEGLNVEGRGGLRHLSFQELGA